jgi:hypothetical protein
VSPDGSVVAYASIGRYRSLVDGVTGEEIWRFDKDPASKGVSFNDGVYAFSPDGRTLAASRSVPSPTQPDRSVYLIEVASGKERHAFADRRGMVYTLAFSADGTALISGGGDGTALVWDLTGRLAAGATRGKPLTGAELDTAWTALAGDDAVAAYSAIQKLAADPDRSATYLGKHLRPVAAGDEKRLQKQTWQKPAPEDLRTLRALEVLERCDTPGARRVLQEMAKGAPGARPTEDAKASLARLTRRGAEVP